MKFNSKFHLLLLFILVSFLIYFKFSRFEALSYFLDDFTNNLEGSYSWLLGRPLTFANGFGKLNTAHNYFLMPLLGLIVLYFGAKGIFVFLVLCQLIVWHYFFKLNPNKSFSTYILFLFLLLNPTFLWIFDHPDVGWSIELLYFPFAILFAISLKLRNNILSIISGLLLISVREEGVILVCMIHVIYLVFNATSWKSIVNNRNIWIYGLGYSFLFIVSMLYLSAKGNSNSFVDSAFSVLNNHLKDATFYWTNLSYFGQGLLLISPFFLFYYFFQKFEFHKFLIFIFFLLLLFALTFFQTIRYYDQFFFQTVSLTWAARFILPFTFTIAFLVININTKLNFKFDSLANKTAISLLFIIQFFFISFVRKDVSYSEIGKILITNEPQHRIKTLINESDIAIIRQIEKEIPARSSVYVGDFLVPIFSNHFVVWPDRYKEYEKADIGIIPKDAGNVHLRNELPFVMKRGYKSIGVFGNYEIFSTERYKKYINLEKLSK